MPILAKQPAVFPEDLLSGRGADCGERVWWAVYTKARQEKRLAHYLFRNEIPFFLPLVARQHVSGGRTLRSHVPVFTGYVFLFGTPEERLHSLTSNRISQVIAVPNQDELYGDLLQLQRLIESNMPLTIESRILPGQRVRVRHGSMAGLEGLVVARRRQTKLLVAVNFLKQGVSIELDDFLLEPV